jgi:hypothetical protein
VRSAGISTHESVDQAIPLILAPTAVAAGANRIPYSRIEHHGNGIAHLR